MLGILNGASESESEFQADVMAIARTHLLKRLADRFGAPIGDIVRQNASFTRKSIAWLSVANRPVSLFFFVVQM